MADERYEWLDKDAAERLLRGESVGPVGDHARAQAERLSAALDAAARAGGPESGELPGEAAALAAFRKARAASPEVFSTVRAGREVPAPVRWGRPVRLGLAGALAGFALGGVAVAAGTGVLPSPFGRNADPAPASSVSAAATPQPAAPGTTGGGPGGPGEPTPGVTGIPDGANETPGSGNGDVDRDGDGGSGGTHESSPGPDTGAPATDPGSADGAAPGTGDGSGSGAGSGSGDWYRKTAKACQDYRTGDLAPDRERRLEAAAKGADRVEGFCDRLLKGSDGVAGTGGSGGEGTSSGGNGDGAGEGHDDGGAGGAGGAGGDSNGGIDGGRSVDGGQGVRDGIRRSVPQVSFTRPASPAVTPATTVVPSPQPG